MVFVRVFDGRSSTYRYRLELKRMGLRFSASPEPHWETEVSEDCLAEIEDWCFDRRLEIETPFSKRSNDYRKRFFEDCEPNFGRDRYLCVYCGLPIRKENVTVDHLIAVKKAQRSKFYLRRLQNQGFESVNDVRNLVPCCKRCNSHKGAKAGLWLVRGWLGKSKGFWYVGWVLELSVLFAALILAASVFGRTFC